MILKAHNVKLEMQTFYYDKNINSKLSISNVNGLEFTTTLIHASAYLRARTRTKRETTIKKRKKNKSKEKEISL